ncbi:MAG: RnfABCDGE type electron transport complex subunit B [Candidatus Cloacimonadota bacterium]|nr:RnfABCDGE type electron transport complex subunit B [Candidatus Cloacimonadota bacterium]
MIATAIIVLGALAIIYGIGLTIASKVFHVKIDPKIEQIEHALPSANCGACAYAGCAAYAEAIVKNGEDISLCAPGGESAMRKIAKIMGKKPSKKERKIALIKCQSGGKNNTILKFENRGIETCQAALLLSNGHNQCDFGCLGFNDCQAACTFDAISVDKNNMRHIDEDKCTGCGNCVEACPKDLIELVPISKKVNILCMSHDKGKIAKASCGNKTACIGCGLCVKKCPVDAISMVNNLAVIDYEKCVVCGLCAEVCPTKAIVDKIGRRPQPKIVEEDCIGCTICAKKCPVNAISGEVKKLHIIDEEKCIQCGICVEKCPKGAIITEY